MWLKLSAFPVVKCIKLGQIIRTSESEVSLGPLLLSWPLCGCQRKALLNLWNNTYLYGFISETLSENPTPSPPVHKKAIRHAVCISAKRIGIDIVIKCLPLRLPNCKTLSIYLSLRRVGPHSRNPEPARLCMHTSKGFSSGRFDPVL